MILTNKTFHNGTKTFVLYRLYFTNIFLICTPAAIFDRLNRIMFLFNIFQTFKIMYHKLPSKEGRRKVLFQKVESVHKPIS